MKNYSYFKKLKKDYRHFIFIGLIVISLLLSIFYFKSAITRIIESLIDIKNSAIFYFSELFELDLNCDITVIKYSKVNYKMPFGLPNNWKEFKAGFSGYWKAFFSMNTFKSYLNLLSNILFYFSKIILIVFPFLTIIYIFINKSGSTVNNDYNEDSKALKRWKTIEKKVYEPIKNWFKVFFQFLEENSYYKKILVWIWLYNFNIIAIVLELIAYYLFFVSAFKLTTIYIQVIKLLLDLSVMINFIPAIIWIFIIIYIFNRIRMNKGLDNLNHMEYRNRGFINERPIVLMLVGTMGKKKTTIVTDIAISEEIILRDKAFEKILEQDLMFPNFPFINLENTIKSFIKKHRIYNLATCKKFIEFMRIAYLLEQELGSNDPIVKSIRRYLKKQYNYNFKNCIFDYDDKKNEMYYYDNLKNKYIWEVLENYTQLYFIYIIESSLILSNYSIRVDNFMIDSGNFPIWNNDIFSRDLKLQEAYTRHAHILDFDSFRLGKKLIEDNQKANSFEFGVVVITEIGKERGNNLELQHVKKNDDICNQKNDLFNRTLKMIRHSATVDNYPFIKIVTDEQRPESWGADARDLCQIVHIEDSSKMKMAMPFFALEDLLIQLFLGFFKKSYVNYRFNRSDNTLIMYWYHNLASILSRYRNKFYNQFGYYDISLAIEEGTQDGTLKESSYYLMSKKIYSDRFSTDCFNDFYVQKALKSKVGLNDLEEFNTSKATFDEMALENSYFFNELIKMNNKE